MAPFSDLGYDEAEDDGLELSIRQAAAYPGQALQRPLNRSHDWSDTPEDEILIREVILYIQQTIARLPIAQRDVIILHDLEGWSADEICAGLGLSDANRRVLLHRARAKVRQTLERYFYAGVPLE
jgi:RNA polymerase sigma-70 factor (ECF subfamily)